MELTISDTQAKELLKLALVELLDEKRELFYEVLVQVAPHLIVVKNTTEQRVLS